MKLILAIINHDDANTVTQALTKKGFSSTKLATTGGFLMAGNVTILIGVDEEKVQTVIDIIREHSHSRKQMIPTTTEMSYGYYPSMPVEVVVGGATIFVVEYKDDGKVDDVKTVSAKTLAKDFADKGATVYGVKNADGDYTALYVAK